MKEAVLGYKPSVFDGSIYTLRRRIPVRPSTDEQDRSGDDESGVAKPGRLGQSLSPAVRLGCLVARLVPRVRVSH